MIKIRAIGGYEEVGRNMTYIESDDEGIIIDMGLYLDRYLAVIDKKEHPTENELIDEGGIPNDRVLAETKKNVKAIILGHGHLDHIGAVRWLASKYSCPIIGSPYTLEVLEQIAKDNKFKIKNKLVRLNPNSIYQLTDNIKIEFINVTHSIPQTVIVNVQTPYGSIVYASDYKFDNNPILGKKTNKKRLKQLAQENIVGLIIDSTRAEEEKKTFSEAVAKDMLRDVLLGTENKGHGIIFSTFSSHLARLKSVIDIGEELNRKVVFLGRSLNKYITAGENLDLINFSERAEIIGFASKARKRLREINKEREKYLIAVTGNQGEPNAMLPRLARDELPFTILPGDFIIFSCNTIPTPEIQANRRLLEKKLKNKKARIFKDIHVSGHGAREDHRDLIKMIAPKHIIPAHGDMQKLSALAELATEIGFKLGETVHILQNGQEINLE